MFQIPQMLNGQLMPARYDDVFRHMLSHFPDDYVGDDQTMGWVVTRLEVTRQDIVEAVSATGNPAASRAGAVLAGTYLVRENSDGLIWAFYYPDTVDADRDYADATELDNRTEETQQ